MRDTIEAAPVAVETSRTGQRRSSVPFELVPREALRVSAGTFVAGVAFVPEQAKRNAKKPPGAAAGLSGSGLGTLFVLRSRRVARPVDAPHIRRQGEGLLRLSHGGTTPGSPRPCAAGSFSSGDFFTFSCSTAGLWCAQSAVPRRPKLPSGNDGPRRLNDSV